MKRDGLTVTVVGWAASTAKEVVGDGVPFTSFRMATTPRYYDSRQGAWTDGHTEWITVKAFRDAAFNVAASIHKGEPVLVQGRLQTEEWVGKDGPRSGLVLDANAVGHDVTRGTAKFARRVNVSPGGAGGDRSDGEAEGVEDPWTVPAQAHDQDGPDTGVEEPQVPDDDPGARTP